MRQHAAERLEDADGFDVAHRGDRYSELRGTLPPDSATGGRRVEMSYIGG